MEKLALFGGKAVRKNPFNSQPKIDENEIKNLNECVQQKAFSRYIGSPVGDFKKILSMTSNEASNIDDYWSVLGGRFVREFEMEVAKVFNVDYAICMNSCTSCLTSAIIASGIQNGDEVVTTPFSFTATATAIHVTGAVVKFADINPDTFCLDLESVERLVTKKTRAIVPVHLLGNAGDILELDKYCRENNLIMIEDSAQAINCEINGIKLGTIGDIGVFSFQETKNIMTGEGGVAITNDPKLAYKLRLIRNHGESMVFSDDPEDIKMAAIGFNFRMPEIIAALGCAQISKIYQLNSIRFENYSKLRQDLVKFDFLEPQLISNDSNGFFPYCAGFTYHPQKLHISRDLFAMALRAEGIPVSTGFPRLLNENFIFKGKKDRTPCAYDLNYNKYLGFFQIGYPNNPEDMVDVVNAIDKITMNASKIIQYSKTHNIDREFNSGRM